MSISIIADHPSPEMYATGLELGLQCARCGSSCGWQECGAFGCDDGDYIAEDGEYPSSDGCDVCEGRGGWHVCLSSPEWCEANPLPGRETVQRGEIEWFTIGPEVHQ